MTKNRDKKDEHRSESVGHAKTIAVKAADAGAEEVAGLLMPVGGKLAYKLTRTLAQHALAVWNRNAAKAAVAFEEELKADAALREKLEAALEKSPLVDSLERQLTLALRAIFDAGRHPDETLQKALGTFAARVCRDKVDDVVAFAVADALSRMTAPEFHYVQTLGDIQEAGQLVWTVTGTPGTRAMKVGAGKGSASPAAMAARLRGVFPWVDASHMEVIEKRLVSFGVLSLGDVPPTPIVDEGPDGPRLLAPPSIPRIPNTQSTRLSPIGMRLFVLTRSGEVTSAPAPSP